LWARNPSGASASRETGRRSRFRPRKRGHSHPAILDSAATTASPVAPRTSEEALRKRHPMDDSAPTSVTWRPGCPDLLYPRCAFRIPKEYSLLDAGASPNRPYLSALLLHRVFPGFARSMEDLSTGVCTTSVENSLGPGPPPGRCWRASSGKHRTSQGGAKYKRAPDGWSRMRRCSVQSKPGAMKTRRHQEKASSRKGEGPLEVSVRGALP